MTQNINNLLNDESKKYQSAKITILPIDEIERNPLNNAPIVNIELLCEQIQQDGLIKPIQVYKVANHEYRLLDGERRWTAHKELGLEEIATIIVPKPETIADEKIFIDGANDQRPDTKEYRLLRIQLLGEAYDEKKERGEIETGTLKRDWISMRMNGRLTGRAIQNYLNELNGVEEASEDKPAVSAPSLNKVSKTMTKLMKELELIDWEALELDNKKQIKEFNEFKQVKSDLEQLLAVNTGVQIYKLARSITNE